MSICYNITPYGITDHIKDNCVEHKDGKQTKKYTIKYH